MSTCDMASYDDRNLTIYVHTTAPTNFKADNVYREQARACMSFFGGSTRIDLTGPPEQPTATSSRSRREESQWQEAAVEEEELNLKLSQELSQLDLDLELEATKGLGDLGVEIMSSPPMPPLSQIVPQKRGWLLGSSQEDGSYGTLKKRRSAPASEPVVQVASSQVLSSTPSSDGFSQPPLAFSSFQEVVRSSIPEPSTFYLPEDTTRSIIHVEPITPARLILPELDMIPQTIIRPLENQKAGHKTKDSSSSIEWDSSPLEIPDSQPSPPAPQRPQQLAPPPMPPNLSQSHDSTITHISGTPPRRVEGITQIFESPLREEAEVTHITETPPRQAQEQLERRKEVSIFQSLSQSRVQATRVLDVGNKVIHSSQELEQTESVSLAKTSIKQVTTTTTSVLETKSTTTVVTEHPPADSIISSSPPGPMTYEFHRPPPNLDSLSPLSPVLHSTPNTKASPDKLPKYFPPFTGAPIPSNSLLKYVMEKDENTVLDTETFNKFLGNRLLGEYHFSSPVPETDSNPRVVTHILEQIYSKAKKLFDPKAQHRNLRKSERGYWRLDLGKWPKQKEAFTEGLLKVKSTNERKLEFWQKLAGYVKSGKIGETNLYFEGPGESGGFGGELGDVLRLYCFGEVVEHIWVVLVVISDRSVAEIGAKWVDAGGVAVVDM